MIADSRTWILIADGAKAEVVQYQGPDGALAPVPEGSFEQPNLRSREIVTDDRGRGFAGKGISEARGAMEFTSDPHEFEEFRFVSQVAKFLDQRVGDFDNLILIAAPRALGILRQKLSDQVLGKTYAELDKELTNVPLPEVRKHLQSVININA